MTERIVDISENGAVLSISTGRLRIESEGGDVSTIPLGEIDVLVGSHPNIRYTQSALVAVTKSGGGLVLCDEKHTPSAIVIPIVGHFAQAERIRKQMEASLPLKKRLWQQIIKNKINAQAATLHEITGNDAGLAQMAKRVRTGDPDNVEAQAARRYWQKLFGDRFRRQTELDDANRYLNYGYAVLRACVARSVVATGLHPSVGLHHHNRYDGFCLASDLMEPFRPFIDFAAVKVYEEFGHDATLSRKMKGILLETLTWPINVGDGEREMRNAIELAATSLASVFEGSRRTMVLPEFP